jgi:hypothetical protein
MPHGRGCSGNGANRCASPAAALQHQQHQQQATCGSVHTQGRPHVHAPGTRMCMHLAHACACTWHTHVHAPGTRMCMHLAHACARHTQHPTATPTIQRINSGMTGASSPPSPLRMAHHCNTCIEEAAEPLRTQLNMMALAWPHGFRPALHHTRLHSQLGGARYQVHPADASRTTPLHSSRQHTHPTAMHLIVAAHKAHHIHSIPAS